MGVYYRTSSASVVSVLSIQTLMLACLFAEQKLMLKNDDLQETSRVL